MSNEQLEREADRLLAEADKQKYKVFATKVSADQARRFETINRIDGVSEYEVIQMLIDAYIRLKDPRQVISPSLNKLRIAFDLSVHVQDCLRLADPSAKVEIREATYYLGDSKHKVMRPIHVFQAMLDGAECTQNTQEILERLVQEFPVLYDKLSTKVYAQRGVSSVYELLCQLAEENDSIEDANAIEEEFSDVNRTDTGREMADAPYRRTMTNSMSVAEERWFREHQTTIDFPDYSEEEKTINQVF